MGGCCEPPKYNIDLEYQIYNKPLMMSCDRRLLIKSTKTNSFGSIKEEESENKMMVQENKLRKNRSSSCSPEKEHH